MYNVIMGTATIAVPTPLVGLRSTTSCQLRLFFVNSSIEEMEEAGRAVFGQKELPHISETYRGMEIDDL